MLGEGAQHSELVMTFFSSGERLDPVATAPGSDTDIVHAIVVSEPSEVNHVARVIDAVPG